MPRHKRIPSPTRIYHWINRGVNRKGLFHFKEDHQFFLKLLGEHKDQFCVEIYHYCLMPNHVHLLLKSPDIESLAKFSQYVQRRYAYYYCKTHKWKGQVFQRMYKSIPVGRDAHLLECGRYIERNPVRARLVNEPLAFEHSSHAFYSEGRENALLTPSPAYLGISDDEARRRMQYREYVLEARPYEEIVDSALLKS